MQAYIVVGSQEKQKEYIDAFCKEHVIPHYLITEFDEFKILDARNLQKILSLKLKESENRVICISSPTPEAQQALLKTVEELPPQNNIFFLVSSPETLLPTILSRCIIVFLEQDLKKVDPVLEKKVRTLAETNKLSLIGDVFGSTVELADLEQVLLILRKIIVEKMHSGTFSDMVIFTFLKNLERNYRLAKSNNINKRLVLETSGFSIF